MIEDQKLISHRALDIQSPYVSLWHQVFRYQYGRALESRALILYQ